MSYNKWKSKQVMGNTQFLKQTNVFTFSHWECKIFYIYVYHMATQSNIIVIIIYCKCGLMKYDIYKYIYSILMCDKKCEFDGNDCS